MDKKVMIVMAAVALMLFTGIATSSYAMAPGIVVQSEEGFDREDCLEECRLKYGGDMFFLQGGRQGGGGNWRIRARLYFRCVERCERAFWKEFDSDRNK